MLQQTQVSRVVPAFERFIAAFPTVNHLADADERQVLALWSGLGYYRRAKNLHRAAKEIVARFASVVPSDVPSLLSLPGVGRYTAGAISSIAHGRPAPIVDGNVKRVLLRIHAQDLDPGVPATDRWTWDHAADLVNIASSPGVFNEALMELGATVCLAPPSRPMCDRCPIAPYCASRAGLWQTIPRPKQVRPPSDVFCTSLFALDSRGRVLLEQRPSEGMWANMWQLPTLESPDDWPSRPDINAFAQMRSLAIQPAPLAIAPIEFTHQTTHRTVRFRVLVATPLACVRKTRTRHWASLSDLDSLGISNAQRRAIAMAADQRTK